MDFPDWVLPEDGEVVPIPGERDPVRPAEPDDQPGVRGGWRPSSMDFAIRHGREDPLDPAARPARCWRRGQHK